MSNLNASNNDVDNLPENLNTALGLNSSSHRDDSKTEQKSNKAGEMEMQVDVDGTSTNDRVDSDNNAVDLPEASANCESTEQKKAGKQDVEVDAIASGTVSPDDLSISVPANEGKSDAKTTDGAEAKTSIYQVKWTRFGNKNVPIITQNENGPCPLLAIANCLTLRHQLKLQPGTDFVLAEQLVQLVCELLLENIPRNLNEVTRPNYEHNVEDAMSVLPKMTSGIDVNVRFTGVDQFEYTPECTVFDLLGIRLYHGWLVDPENLQEVSAVSNCTYNQLVERIITRKSASDEASVIEASIAEDFLNRTASQLTYHGLCELNRELADGQLCVFFRNNHFVTLHKHQKELFQLVTDFGYLKESSIVWETLNNVEGDGEFVDADFKLYKKSSPVPTKPQTAVTSDQSTSRQFDNDLQLALSLQEQEAMAAGAPASSRQWMSNEKQQQMSDFELAQRLQEEETRQANMHQERHQQQNASRNAQPRQQQQQPPQAEKKSEKSEKNCVIS